MNVFTAHIFVVLGTIEKDIGHCNWPLMQYCKYMIKNMFSGEQFNTSTSRAYF